MPDGLSESRAIDHRSGLHIYETNPLGGILE